MKKTIFSIVKFALYPIKLLFLLLIYLYRLIISPFLPHTCRFRPSCSKYAIRAFKEFGIYYGFKLTIKRLLKCKPSTPGGIDPVPDNIKGDIKWVL